MYHSYDSNMRKTWALMTIFFIVVIGIGFGFAQVYGDPIILYGAVLFSIFMNFLSYWYSDKIVLSISGARPADKETYWDLYTVTENLAITAGIPMPKLYVIPDAAPNAFATGRNAEHATVAVTEGLLGMLTRSELEGVIAHELSHIKNRDILLSTVVVVLVGFVSILADIFLRGLVWGGGRSREGRAGGILAIAGLALAILSPIFVTLIQLAISRKREFVADASGALLTRYPEGLASALEKISSSALPMHTSKAIAHLYISDPFAKQPKTGFFTKLFMTHPPVEERIAALMGLKNTDTEVKLR